MPLEQHLREGSSVEVTGGPTPLFLPKKGTDKKTFNSDLVITYSHFFLNFFGFSGSESFV